MLFKGKIFQKKSGLILSLLALIALDVDLLPIGMKIYPSNHSEKPILRSIIDFLKQQDNIIGKTI